MAASVLLKANRNPDEAATKAAIANLCRWRDAELGFQRGNPRLQGLVFLARETGHLPDRLGEHVDRHGRRADGLKPVLAVPLRARWVEQMDRTRQPTVRRSSFTFVAGATAALDPGVHVDGPEQILYPYVP